MVYAKDGKPLELKNRNVSNERGKSCPFCGVRRVNSRLLPSFVPIPSHRPIQLLSKWFLQVLANAFTHNVFKGQRDTWETLASPAQSEASREKQNESCSRETSCSSEPPIPCLCL